MTRHDKVLLLGLGLLLSGHLGSLGSMEAAGSLQSGVRIRCRVKLGLNSTWHRHGLGLGLGLVKLRLNSTWHRHPEINTLLLYAVWVRVSDDGLGWLGLGPREGLSCTCGLTLTLTLIGPLVHVRQQHLGQPSARPALRVGSGLRSG